jgi:hypothetical protein
VSVKVTLDGFSEFYEALGALPAGLTDASRPFVHKAADQTEAETVAGYPGTGHMRAGVKQAEDSHEGTFAIAVRSTAPEAHLWEYGTENRHTQKGWNRGAAPAHRDQSLLAIAESHRQTMNGELAAMVTQAGFEVSGAFDTD